MAQRNVTFLINANTRNFTKGLNSASRKFKRFGRNMERMGRTMTQNVTAPLAAIGGLAIKSAGDFESSFADIRKTVDATEAQFAQMSKEMRALAKTVPTSVNELNRMAGVAGQLGVGTENIVRFTKTIAMLGDTTDVAGEQAALSLSRFMNVMGTAEGDIDRLGSTIVGLGNNFAAMESEIVEIATSMSPLGNSIGLTEQQVLSFATTIAASGGKTEAASTAFQKTANTMKQAVISGNKDLKVFAETAGMTSNAFKRAFEQDAAGALQSFLKGLRRVQKEGGSTASVLDQIGLADQRLVREFGKILGNLDDLDRALKLSNQEWRKNTALTDEASKRYNTFNSRLKILRNRINDLGITIGDLLIPVVNKIINLITNATEWVSSLSRESKVLGLQIASVAMAIGPTVFAIGKLSTVIGILLNPIGLVVAGMAGLATAIYTNWDDITRFFSSEGPKFMQPVLKSSRKIIDRFSDFFKELLKIFRNQLINLLAFWEIFGEDIFSFIKDTFTGVINIMSIAFDALSVALDTFSGRWITDWEGYLEDTKESFNNVFGADGSLVQIFTDWVDRIHGMVNPLIGAKDFLFNIFSEDAKQAEKQAEETVTSIEETVTGLVSRLGGLQFKMPSFGFGGVSGGDSEPTQPQTRQESPIGRVSLPTTQRMQEIAQGFTRTAQGANRFKKALGGASQMSEVAMSIAHDFTNSFGAGMANIVVQGEKLADVLKNIGKLLVSSAIQKGISLLLTGGLSGAGFFGSGGGLFGSIFGVNDALITSGGDVVKFHPDDNILAMKDFSNLGGGKQVIENRIFLDSREIHRGLQDLEYGRR